MGHAHHQCSYHVLMGSSCGQNGSLTQLRFGPHAVQPEGRDAEEEELLRALSDELHATWASTLGPCMRVGVLCGGPGPDQDASLDAARTLVDHLETIHLFETGAPNSLLCWC